MYSKGPVVNLDRTQKAQMIEAFLIDGLGHEVAGLRVLDIGCGNGQISKYFADRNEVFGVDVSDRRADKECCSFTLVEDETLPFGGDSFDVVISHHVIEHVENQPAHLAEIKRVLKPNGLAYVACPNGGSPLMAGHVGNDQVPTLSGILQLLDDQGFQIEECYTRLLKQPRKYHCETAVGRFVPTFFLKSMRRWYPGHCFLLRR